MKTKYSFIIILLLYNLFSYSQTINDSIAKATEFSIPSSGAFSLLGVNPSIVNRPGFTKDFSVDNFIKDGKILDNIAIDAQPFWILFFNHKSINQYQDSTCSLLRYLSKVNISIGTVKTNNLRQLAYSGKYTFQKDPMMDKDYINRIENITTENLSADERFSIMSKITSLKKMLKKENKPEIKDSIQTEIDSKQNELNNLSSTIEKTINAAKKKLAQDYIEEHWADFIMDIGVGQIYNYNSPSIDSLSLISNGFGIWVNPAYGFATSKNKIHSNKIQFSALLKLITSDNKNDGYAGLNIRYGTSKINAFVEYVYENNNKNISNTIAYGATYKIDNKKVIELGLRHQLDKNFELKNFYPVVSINWALANDILK